MEDLETLVQSIFQGKNLNLSANTATDSVYSSITALCQLIISEQYADADAALKADKILSASQKVELRKAASRHFLFGHQREWSSHGIWRSFRFWSTAEKQEYLNRCRKVADALKRLTPYVSFGFGSVLGFVRDNDFIPHDDDMDLLVAFPAKADSCFSAAKRAVRDHLEAEGLKVYNENPTHVTVNGADVFIGFIEQNDTISWFPSNRGGLMMSDVFPVTTRLIFGVLCEIPANPERYLEITYGADWRSPISDFKHPWDQSQYKDFRIGEKM